MSQEQLVELTLEIGWEVTRGPATPDLVVDLGADLVEVPLRRAVLIVAR